MKQMNARAAVTADDCGISCPEHTETMRKEEVDLLPFAHAVHATQKKITKEGERRSQL